MKPVRSVEGLVEGVVYHNEHFQPYVLTRCIVCGKPKVSTLYKGAVQYPKCFDCANHTPEKQEMTRRLFKGKPKSDEQRQKLSASLLGRPTNRHESHMTDAGKAKLSALYKGRKLSEETKHRMSVAVKARPPHSLEQRRKNSLALKGRRPSQKTIEASRVAHLGRVITASENEKRSKSEVASWCDPTVRERRLTAQRDSLKRPEVRAKLCQNSQRMWDNRSETERNAIVQKILKGANREPNRKELRLGQLIDMACPNEYIYTGDGGFAIGGKIPDFTNVNGHKKVIELFGDYWHGDALYNGQVQMKWHRTEEGCRETYAHYGFDCLVIWEKELKSQTVEQLVSRIREFTYRQGQQL